ncbi:MULTISPECIES: hypothetical protein [Myroides]|uniref:hypothetical protein n=1 Tax=Myroides TaxID=76831 RepID=UPI002180065A|nr:MULTISPECIES: hypothetical protein [Myroides]MCS7472026.1 hypothetical protein [Myroides odoratimimus]MDM1459144.1 hypothetical protein [Myroides odoratimimus]
MRQLFFTFFLILVNVVIHAQNTAQTNLIVTLKPIQSIKINDQQSNINLSFETVEDYTKGKISDQADHIEVMSSGTYEVRVAASSPLTSNNEQISLENISLNPTLGTIGDFRENITMIPVSLSMKEHNMISSNLGDVKRTFNVSYKMDASEELLNKPVGTYSTVITYTILSL